MKTYITEIRKEGGEYEGPTIRAYSWLEAEGIAGRLNGVTLVGELDD